MGWQPWGVQVGAMGWHLAGMRGQLQDAWVPLGPCMVGREAGQGSACML